MKAEKELKKYEVVYLDSKFGDTVMTTEVLAEDESEALDVAYDEDYYFGKLISITEV